MVVVVVVVGALEGNTFAFLSVLKNRKLFSCRIRVLRVRLLLLDFSLHFNRAYA